MTDTSKYYQPIGTKTIQCIDCGKDVEVDALDNQTNRCESVMKCIVEIKLEKTEV